jgi:UDP-glucose 4-epimerase
MKILFTGASSFTGFWFVSELARAGHEIVATFRKRVEDYCEEPRGTRVRRVLECCRGIHGCNFGDASFLELLGGERWDLLCHHSADGANYKSEDFDAVEAFRSNTFNIVPVLQALRRNGSPRVSLLLTGSVFENDEGCGTGGVPAFSSYGLSKGYTYQAYRYYANREGLPLGKFVIANPFGPLEEHRFTAYLMKTWFTGGTATVRTPAYVRDNIHVSLLARAYVRFAERLGDSPSAHRMSPSGYTESQGDFALRYANEMRGRLGLACELELLRQTAFPEPRVRINTDSVDGSSLGWSETSAWDDIADYYRALYAEKPTRHAKA